MTKMGKQMKTVGKRGSRGASLIETLIALALGTFVTMSAFNLFAAQDRIYSMEGQAEKTQRNARVALDSMTRDIRVAGYRSQIADIDSALATSFTFQADVDNDAVTEKVKYARNVSNQITREVWEWNGMGWNPSGGAQSVAEYTSALDFSYLDANGNLTATLADIRVVRIALAFISPRADPVSGAHRTITLSSDITLRNLAN